MELYRKIDCSCTIVNDSKSYIFLKRVLDIVGGMMALILFIPIICAVSIAIKIEDPRGPIFFKQIRHGQDNKTFRMYKFRSMFVGAEKQVQNLKELNEQSGPVFKIKNDPRITKVGKFIRKTSLDEIPQFINVLKGDMSIVGPRPALPCEVKQYNDMQKQRLLVKPGITCIWQVSGRNNVDFNEWVKMDINYIKNRSMLLDIKLILLTIPALLGDKNAS